MCDGPCNENTFKEDVRATKKHVVSLTLLVDAEDSGMAIELVCGRLLTNVHVERVSAMPYQEEDAW